MAIRIKDFDLKQWVEDPSRSCKLLIHGKGRRERYVPVLPKIMQRILTYVQDQEKGMDDRLFSFSKNQWHDAFKDAIKETMDYDFTLHDLRRSRATYWIEQGLPLIKVRNRLGHNSVQTTQVYINLDEEKEFDEWANE